MAQFEERIADWLPLDEAERRVLESVVLAEKESIAIDDALDRGVQVGYALQGVRGLSGRVVTKLGMCLSQQGYKEEFRPTPGLPWRLGLTYKCARPPPTNTCGPL